MEKREIQLVPQTYEQVVRLLDHPPAIEWHSGTGLDEYEDRQIMARIVEFFNFSFPAGHQPHNQPQLVGIYRDSDKLVVVVTWRYDYMKYANYEGWEDGYDIIGLSNDELERVINFWNAAARHMAWKKRQDLALAAAVPNDMNTTAGFLALLEAAGLNEKTDPKRRDEVITAAWNARGSFLAGWLKTNPEPPKA